MNTLTPAEIAAARAAIQKLTPQTGRPEFEGAVALISGLMDKLSCPDGSCAALLPDLAQIRSVLRVITQLHAKIRRGVEPKGSLSPEMEDSLCCDVSRGDRATGRAAGIAYDDQAWSHIRTLCIPFVGTSMCLGLLGWILHSVVLGALAAICFLPVVHTGWRVLRFRWINRGKIAAAPAKKARLDRDRGIRLVTARIQAENEAFLSAALEELRRELATTLNALEEWSAKG